MVRNRVFQFENRKEDTGAPNSAPDGLPRLAIIYKTSTLEQRRKKGKLRNFRKKYYEVRTLKQSGEKRKTKEIQGKNIMK